MKLKRIYEKPAPDDGYRVLIDRLWPRGMSKEKAALDEWNRNVSPSTALRKWFDHQPELFKAFSEKYKEELLQHTDDLERLKSIAETLKSIAETQDLTLLYASKDEVNNHSVILLEVLNNLDDFLKNKT